MVDEDGERVIYVLVKGSAFEAIEPEDLLFLEEMNPDALCFTGVIIGAHPVEESAILAARRWKGRAKLYFDPNLCYPADQVPEEIKKATRELADLCDVVLTGETEMRALGLSPKKGQCYIVKCGGKGSKWMDEKEVERYQIPATKHRPTDTTGAGDTFMQHLSRQRPKGLRWRRQCVLRLWLPELRSQRQGREICQGKGRFWKP